MVTIQINPGNIELSEIIQVQKDNYLMISLVCEILKSQAHRNRTVVVRRWKRETKI